MQFEVDGASIATVSSSPYTTSWNSTGVSDGTHTLYAVAKNSSGNYATSSISIITENTPVSISSISSDTPGSSSATITWTTNEAASSTILYGTTASYGSASSNTSLVTSHSITLSGLAAGTTYHFQVQATNAAGDYATSTDQTFTTATNPPAISSISASATTTSATVTWTTDESSNSEVVYGTTTSYGSASSSAADVTSHSISLTGLTNSTTYHYEVVCTNGNDQTSTSTDQTFTTGTTSPTVSLTAPASNADVSGSSVTLTATASESGATIAHVQFEVGTTSIATISSSPYTTTWNSTGVSDGSYTLYAVAKDTSGNYATSSESITVDNGPPTVSFSAPTSGATVGGSAVTLTATASDDVGVASVQFQVDGSNIGSALTSSPYTTTWNSTGIRTARIP